MKKEGIIFGASLFAIAFSFNANAQTCNAPPTCNDLGYVQTAADCPSGGVRCPFDTTKMYCIEPCTYGSILYSDKTCSKKVKQGHFPIAVVVEPFIRLAVALQPAGGIYKWGEGNWTAAAQIDGLEDCNNSSSCQKINDGQVNTAIIKAFGKQHKAYYPAVDAVLAYATMGTNEGDWFLPSVQQFEFMRAAKTEINKAFDLMGKNGDLMLGSWTSNEADATKAMASNASGLVIYSKDTSYSVVPMMNY